MVQGYVHSFSAEEQERLYWQARFLEQTIYEKVDFSHQGRIIEVGCGVGAQTEILLERFPHLQIEGVDASPPQIDRARRQLEKAIREKRVNLNVGDAARLPFPDDSFDGAFLCWFLEHVQNPIEILSEVRRVLKPHGVIYCNEVLNATFYIHPYSPATLQYWFAFNDHQWSLKGDPFVGGKLANHLLAAGFQDISTEVKIHHYDNRSPKKRMAAFSDWARLLLSGAKGLLEAGKVTQELVTQMKEELERLKNEKDSVFFSSWVQAKAFAL